MPKYDYLIVGGGMTANAAARGIREIDQRGSIGIIGSEPHSPYSRPPLSKGLWKGDPPESVQLRTEEAAVTLHGGRRAQALNPTAKSVTDDQGTTYEYGKLLLATGGTPRRFPFGGDSILYYRTLDDYYRLHEWHERGSRFAVIGGGFIGSEIAAALAVNDRKVSMLFPAAGISDRVFPADLSQFVNDYYRKKGVDLYPGEHVSDVQPRGKEIVVRTQSGKELVVDGVVAGIGIEPNLDLARSAGLKIEDGVVVDEALRTSNPDIYAAGDMASFYNPALGKRLRVEHEDNANTMGRMAGRSMAGDAVRYDHLPFFYSDLFELGYEAVGEFDPHMQTVADWKEPYREGVIYYLREGRVRGVLLWNVWGQVDAARALINEPGPFQPEQLKGRLPSAQ